LEHHGDSKDIARAEGDLLAPVRVEEAFPVEESRSLPISRRNASADVARTVVNTPPKNAGSP
jgi:hypothetical protein